MGSKKPRNSMCAAKARSVRTSPKPRRKPARPKLSLSAALDDVSTQFWTVRALIMCVRHALVEVADPASVEAVTAEPEDQVNRLVEGIGACGTCLQQALTMFGAAYDALDRVRP